MEFPGNSHNVTDKTTPTEKPAKKTVEKVVSTEVVKRKTPLGRRFKAVVFGGEFKGAMKYIMGDVLLPAFKNMVVDATTKGVERVIYGEASPRRRSDIARNARVSYNSPVDRYSRRPAMLPDQPPIGPRRQDAGEIVLVSREEAELVLERLNDLIDNYDVASLADLHDLVGLPSTYVDNKWGWSSLLRVGVRQVRDGYLIDLPPVESI